MKRLALLLVAALVFGNCGGISVKQQIDRDDRVAFESLRLFQLSETAAFRARAPWPTAAQHQQIGAKLSQAYDLVIDVANAGLALQPGVAASDQIVTETVLLLKLVGEIVTLAQAAPPNVVSQAIKAHADTQALTQTVTGGK